MFELLIIAVAIAVMVRVANLENRSPFIWGCVTFALCFLSLTIPFPFLRVVLAMAVSFGAMFVSKLITGR